MPITPINNVEQLAVELRAIRRQLKFTRMAKAMGYELVLRPQKTVVFEELADIFPFED